jgi:hypothetical protein
MSAGFSGFELNLEVSKFEFQSEARGSSCLQIQFSSFLLNVFFFDRAKYVILKNYVPCAVLFRDGHPPKP